jgi:hypothetical protein
VINRSDSLRTDQAEIWPEGILDDFSKNPIVVEVQTIGANNCLNTLFWVEDATHARTITSVIELGASPLEKGTNSPFPDSHNLGRPIPGWVAKEFGDVCPRSWKQILEHKAVNPGT